MRVFATVSLAAVLAVGTAGAGFAAVGSDQAREANARNGSAPARETAPSADQGNQPGHASSAHDQAAGSGRSVGPGAGGDTANTPLGYAKGRGESSSVGKEH